MIPSNEDIGRLISTGDPFRISVVGFSAIEKVLEELISESLSNKHRLELSRLSPSFKVDLAIGLGVFDINFKGIVLKLAKIRNKYAHEVNEKNIPFDVKELISSMEDVQRKSIRNKESPEPVSVLGFAVLTTFIDITSRIKWLDIQRQQRLEKLAELRAVLDETPVFNDVKETEYYLKLSERIEKRKQDYLEKKPQG